MQIVSVTHKKILTIERKHVKIPIWAKLEPKVSLFRQQVIPREKPHQNVKYKETASNKISVYLINKKPTQLGNVEKCSMRKLS